MAHVQRPLWLTEWYFPSANTLWAGSHPHCAVKISLRASHQPLPRKGALALSERYLLLIKLLLYSLASIYFFRHASNQQRKTQGACIVWGTVRACVWVCAEQHKVRATKGKVCMLVQRSQKISWLQSRIKTITDSHPACVTFSENRKKEKKTLPPPQQRSCQNLVVCFLQEQPRWSPDPTLSQSHQFTT